MYSENTYLKHRVPKKNLKATPTPKKNTVNDAEEMILGSTIAETVSLTLFKQNYEKQK